MADRLAVGRRIGLSFFGIDRKLVRLGGVSFLWTCRLRPHFHVLGLWGCCFPGSSLTVAPRSPWLPPSRAGIIGEYVSR
jgi:hypothetical protein